MTSDLGIKYLKRLRQLQNDLKIIVSLLTKICSVISTSVISIQSHTYVYKGDLKVYMSWLNYQSAVSQPMHYQSNCSAALQSFGFHLHCLGAISVIKRHWGGEN